MSKQMQIKKLSENALEIRIKESLSNFHKKFLLISDLHQDSKKAKLNLLKRHLTEAQEIGAKVFVFGDVLDLMGHHRDPRSKASDLKESLRVTDYFDQVINEAAEFFKPFADNIVCFADGNHETNILLRHSVNILSHLCSRLEAESKSKIYYLPSDGWIRFKFEAIAGGNVKTKTLFFNHFGNGGRRSKGVLGADLRQADIEADIYVTGHNHMKFTVPQSRLYLNKAGKEVEKRKLHINLGCYKGNEPGSYGRIKGYYTTNLGGYFLEFITRYENRNHRIYCRAIEAI